ncbi:hypothetical protein Holit_01000 [Hollandina sp. SP2]
MGISEPVTESDAGEARYTIAPWRSSVEAIRPSGTFSNHMSPTDTLEKCPAVYDIGGGIRGVTVFIDLFCSGLVGEVRLEDFPVQAGEVGLPLG